MIDHLIRPVIDPPLDQIGRGLARMGVRANTVTTLGLVLGLGAGAAVWAQAYGLALVLVLASRLADGLDGAVARASRLTDTGGYYDIVADYVFYAVMPLAFVLVDPATNGAAGAFLLAAFYINGGSFLGYAILAHKRGLTTRARGIKSFFYSGGLLEGAETIVFFCALCLWPLAFVPLAWVFGGLCLLTAMLRVAAALRDQG